MKKLAFLLIPIYIIVCFIISYKTMCTNVITENHTQNNVDTNNLNNSYQIYRYWNIKGKVSDRLVELDKIISEEEKETWKMFDALLSKNEEKAWKKFDTFWIEFQNAVINEDMIKLKKLSIFSTRDKKEDMLRELEYFITDCNTSFKRVFENVNRKNGYKYSDTVDTVYYNEHGHTIGPLFKFIWIERDSIHKEFRILLNARDINDNYWNWHTSGYFTLKNGKYKLYDLSSGQPR